MRLQLSHTPQPPYISNVVPVTNLLCPGPKYHATLTKSMGWHNRFKLHGFNGVEIAIECLGAHASSFSQSSRTPRLREPPLMLIKGRKSYP